MQCSESKAVLPWLEPLLSAAFFHPCETHCSETRRSNCNRYCLRCNVDAFCKQCMSAHHQDHEVIQIRKNDYREAVRISDIKNILEISGVQTYSCNEYEVVYLKKKPQQPASNDNSHKCETCETSNPDPQGPFCSLRCKLEASKKNANVIIVLSDNSKKDEERKGREEEEQQQKQQEGQGQEQQKEVKRRRKSRKGKPSRAPFF